MQKVLVDCFAARELFCGDNFTFGARAGSNPGTAAGALQTVGHRRPYCTDGAVQRPNSILDPHPRCAGGGGRLGGRQRDARRALCHRLACCSRQGHRRRHCWYANAEPELPAAALRPCAGVYLTRIFLDGQWRPAATGIGKRPTVDSNADAAVTCETFVAGLCGGHLRPAAGAEISQVLLPRPASSAPLRELAALIHRAADESKAYFAGEKCNKIICKISGTALVFLPELCYTNQCYRGPVWGVCLNGSNYPAAPTADIFFQKEVFTNEPRNPLSISSPSSLRQPSTRVTPVLRRFRLLC